MLICRVLSWPTPDEQKALIEQMLSLGLRRPITSALLDLTAADNLPDPDVLAEAFANAAGQNALFSRIGCVVRTPKQEQFASTLKHMSTRPDEVRVFDDEDAALKWLGVDERFRR